jgi:hypothetical protein
VPSILIVLNWTGLIMRTVSASLLPWICYCCTVTLPESSILPSLNAYAMPSWTAPGESAADAADSARVVHDEFAGTTLFRLSDLPTFMVGAAAPYDDPPCQQGIVSAIPAHPKNCPPSRRISVHVALELGHARSFSPLRRRRVDAGWVHGRSPGPSFGEL